MAGGPQEDDGPRVLLGPEHRRLQELWACWPALSPSPASLGDSEPPVADGAYTPPETTAGPRCPAALGHRGLRTWRRTIPREE